MDEGSGRVQNNVTPQAREHYRQGVALLKERKMDEARRELVAELKLVPKYPEALKALAVTYKAQGKKNEASKYFSAAAMACVHLRRYDDADALYKGCLASGLKAENPYQRAAGALREAGRHEQALKLYERGLQCDPAHAPLAAGYAMAKAGAGQVEDAHRFLRSYVAERPETEEALQNMVCLPEPTNGETAWNACPPPEITGGVDFDPDLPDMAVDETGQQELVEELAPEVAPGNEKRRSRRIPLADCSIRYAKRKDPLPVIDICREGVGFKNEGVVFEKGAKLTLDLLGLEKVKVKKFRVLVRHVTGEHVGCEFVDLSDKQRKQIDDLLFADDKDKNDDFESVIGVGKDINFDLDVW